MVTNRVFGPELIPLAAARSNAWDESAWNDDEESDESGQEVYCWVSEDRHNAPFPAIERRTLFNALESFVGLAAWRASLNRFVRTSAGPSAPDVVTIEFSQYEALIKRIVALESKANIEQAEIPDIPESLMNSLLDIISEIFGNTVAVIEQSYRDGEDSIIVRIRVEADATPREMATKTVEWHEKLRDAHIHTPRIRLKIAYT